MSDRPTRLRQFFARLICARAGAGPRIEAAFAAVPREIFAGPPPWSISAGAGGYVVTPDGDPAYLYQDALVALDPARGINIGEPGLHARCLAALDPQPGETVLQVGAGSGYYTAILAELVGPDGRVIAYEIDPALAARAATNLLAWPQAELRPRSGVADGLPVADAIYVNAALTQPSRAWLDALRPPAEGRPGGRLMFPLHAPGGFGGMLMITRAAGPAWPARFVSPAGFIPCSAPQDEAAGRALTAAFADGSWRLVRSFRTDAPDATTSWHAGDGWWLSTAEV